MYAITRHTRQFDFSEAEHIADYDAVLNDPLCTILDKVKEKLRDEERDGDTGRTISVKERLVFLVTWEVKKLC